MINDKALAIGCAISKYTKDNWKISLMCCNYSYGNVAGVSTYQKAKTAAGELCQRKSNVYKGLCRPKPVKKPKPAKKPKISKPKTLKSQIDSTTAKPCV